jgi:hypothetical protein
VTSPIKRAIGGLNNAIERNPNIRLCGAEVSGDLWDRLAVFMRSSRIPHFKGWNAPGPTLHTRTLSSVNANVELAAVRDDMAPKTADRKTVNCILGNDFLRTWGGRGIAKINWISISDIGMSLFCGLSGGLLGPPIALHGRFQGSERCLKLRRSTSSCCERFELTRLIISRTPAGESEYIEFTL